MKVLLDTCTLIWLATEPKRLSRKARAAIDDASNELWLADVSVLELGLKYSAGKIAPAAARMGGGAVHRVALAICAIGSSGDVSRH